MNRFLGVDLAWNTDGRHSAVAVLEGDPRGVMLRDVSVGLCTRHAVVGYLRDALVDDTVLAIDASLVVPNATGQRHCETLVARAFGRYGASCHSTNHGRPHWDAGPRLLAALACHGVRHDFELHSCRRRGGRWALEVYPHPAMVRLFGLDRILQYKKGGVECRRAGLADLARRLRGLPSLRSGSQLAALLDLDPSTLRGSELKHHEDRLDALFCAYLAWHCWRFGAERNEVFGSLAEGYVVVPSVHTLTRR